MRFSRIAGLNFVDGPLYGLRAQWSPSHDPYIFDLDHYWARAGFHIVKLVVWAFVGSGRNI